jgi:hypothetical protein
MLDARYTRISRKWVGFVTAIWVQSIAGNNYTFANYSPELKAVMHYNQLQLNNLGVAKDVGKSFGLLAGLLADRLPTWLILLIGAVEGAVGYGTQYLVIAQKITPPSYWQVRFSLFPLPSHALLALAMQSPFARRRFIEFWVLGYGGGGFADVCVVVYGRE